MMMDYETKAKLAKNCPFCGGKQIVTKRSDFIRDGGLLTTEIKCNTCGAEVRSYTDECDPVKGYREALKVWNRRAIV